MKGTWTNEEGTADYVVPISFTYLGAKYHATLEDCFHGSCTATIEVHHESDATVLGAPFFELHTSARFSNSDAEVSTSFVSTEVLYDELVGSDPEGDRRETAKKMDALLSTFGKLLFDLAFHYPEHHDAAIDGRLVNVVNSTFRVIAKQYSEGLADTLSWGESGNLLPVDGEQAHGLEIGTPSEAEQERQSLVEHLKKTVDPCLAYTSIHTSMLLEALAGTLEEQVERAERLKPNIILDRGSRDGIPKNGDGTLLTSDSWLQRGEALFPWRVYDALGDSPLFVDLLQKRGGTASLAYRDLISGAACDTANEAHE